MRRSAIMLAACAVVAMPGVAIAQSGPTRSVDDYLCTFAGKCASEQPADDESIEAPETKGMVLARRAKPAGSQSATTAPSASGSRNSASAVRPQTRPTRVASSNAGRAVARPSQGKRMNLRLSFMYNSAELTPQAREEAKVFAKSLLMPELAGKRFLIEGHTDSSGGHSYNLNLSARRAAAVAAYLQSLGVPKSRLEVRGFGPDRPIEGRSASSPENRRVEAVLL